jgi:hypothetical protein
MTTSSSSRADPDTRGALGRSHPRLLAACIMLLSMFSACHRGTRRSDGPSVPRPSAAVKLQCPGEAPSRGPIPVEVTLDANARTYWDNQGILDQALSIVLVRRDRPGLMTVAKVDPSAMVMPPSPLPDRPSDEALARDGARVTEQKSYDVLAYGRQHPGAADYFVVATFADAWAGPVRLGVTDPSGPLAPTPDVSGLAAATAQAQGQAENPAIPSSPAVVTRLGEQGGKPAIVGGFRVPADKGPDPFVTLLLANLRTTGGTLVRQFRLPARQDNADLVGGFAVPLSALDTPNPSPAAGRYVLFAFVGDQAAVPTIVDLP